jgi:hypothetical protein
VVPPKLTPLKQKSLLVMQQGGKASVTLFRYVASLRLYPCSITGAPELGYLCLSVRPFNSEVHSASALLLCFHHVPLGSLEIALKRTRPRQRLYI